MHMVPDESRREYQDFSNEEAGLGGGLETLKRGTLKLCPYSSTLSSSFLCFQLAAAPRKARMTGCGFFSVDESCG